MADILKSPRTKSWSRVDELANALAARFATIPARYLRELGEPAPRPAMVDPAIIAFITNKSYLEKPPDEWPERDRLTVEAMWRAVQKAGQWPFRPVFLEWRGKRPTAWQDIPAGLYLRDGHHRTATARSLGIAEIPALIQWPEGELDPPASILAGVRELADDDAEAFKARFVEGYEAKPPTDAPAPSPR